MLTERVRAAINARFPGQVKPRVLFVDRGAGFYFARTGKATAGFGAALREHNLRDYMDGDAAEQPARSAVHLSSHVAARAVLARLGGLKRRDVRGEHRLRGTPPVGI